MKLLDGVLRPGGLKMTERLLGYCNFKAGDKVVDLGCGVGTTVDYLVNFYGLDARGVDLSEAAVEMGKKRFPGIKLIEASAEYLPFADSSLDGVFAECSLSVMQYSNRVLAETNRVLVNGGILAISDLYIRDEKNTIPAWHTKETNCLTGAKSYTELTKILTENGFNILVWEEHSEYLKEFIVRYIMEYGSLEDFWPCNSKGSNDEKNAQVKKSSVGYFLLVAEKQTQ